MDMTGSGNRTNPKILTDYLDERVAQMPHVMVSYACVNISLANNELTIDLDE